MPLNDSSASHGFGFWHDQAGNERAEQGMHPQAFGGKARHQQDQNHDRDKFDACALPLV